MCPAVAGCVFPRASEARPQCRARGAEEGRERRGERGHRVGGTRTWDAHQPLLGLGDRFLSQEKMHPEPCQEGLLPVCVLGISALSLRLTACAWEEQTQSPLLMSSVSGFPRMA